MASQALWQNREETTGYGALQESCSTGALVVGGGLVGVLTAYLLQQEGMQVLLIDAHRVGGSSSGRNTGKLTCQHGTVYSTLLEQGKTGLARDYYQANRSGVELILSLAQSLSIPCDLQRQDTYLFTSTQGGARKLEAEQRAYEKLGIPGVLLDSLPFPMPVQKALCMGGQYGYDPYAFLTGLAKRFVEAGGRICEDTRAVDLRRGELCQVETDSGHTITCNQLVMASHYPFYDGGGMYFSRLEPHRSYLIAARTPGEGREYEGAYLTIDDHTPTIRFAKWHGRSYVLVGGEDHVVGEENHRAYDSLQKFLQERLGISQVAAAWSAQDNIPPDSLPYIGRLTPKDENIHLATGFCKWGNSWSGASALMLRDMITRGGSELAKSFSPARVGSVLNPSFVKAGAHVAVKYVSSKLAGGDPLLPDERGVGRVVNLEGKHYGCYRDREGTLYAVDITCPHMGCELVFNQLEQSWDCPCHGSRFGYDGKQLEGPAVGDLRRYGDGDNHVDPKIFD